MALKRRCFVSAILMGLACAMSVRGAEPAVLTEIPADANGAVVVSNVAALSTKLSNTINRLNVPLPIPLPPDLAGFALRNMGINKGFDQTGSAALVVLKPLHEGDEPFAGGPPPFILLLPTTSSKDMLEGFSPGEPDSAGISQVTLQGGADTGYVTTIDKWVAFAQDREALVAYMARKDSLAKSLPAEARAAFEKNDVVAWGNVASLSPFAIKGVENLQDEMTSMIDLANLSQNQDQVVAALQKEMVGQYFDLIKQYLKDADNAMLTLRLSDAGATLGMAETFKDGTAFAKFIAAQKSRPLSLSGLPGGPFLAAGALTFDSASLSKIVSNVSKDILSNDVIAKDPRVADFRKLADQYVKLAENSNGVRGIILPGPTGGKQGIISGVILIDSDTPEKYQSLQREMMKSPVLNAAMDADISQTATISQNAVTIKDIKLDKIHIVYKLREETPENPVKPQSAQAYKMIKKMYGDEGLTIYIGVVGKHVINIIGSDSATLESAVGAAVDDVQTLPNDPQLTNLKDQLVENPVMVGYFPVTSWAKMAHTLIPSGDGIPPIPEFDIKDAPPLAISAGITGRLYTQELHVPTDTISAFIEAAKNFKKAAPGGDVPPPAPQP